ncbi:UNVERIFIED_CONTAM: hypothetical protein Sindi_0958900, partial [Sesamum indicum]
EVIQEFYWVLWQLAGSEWSRRFLDLRYLHPWVLHIMTNEEARVMMRQCQMMRLNWLYLIWQQIKSLGQMGIPRDFIKAAWPIVGAEVTQAVRDSSPLADS